MTDLEAAVFCLRNLVCWRQEDEGLLLYDVERDIVYEGNLTALQVVEQCDGQRTVGEIADYLAARYKTRRSQALADATSIIQQMLRLNLIERTA